MSYPYSVYTPGPPVAAVPPAAAPVVVEQTTTSSGASATGIIAWVTFFIVIILILIIIFVFFFNGTAASQTVEVFGANYQYIPNPPDVTQPVITSGNTIFLIESGTPSGTSVTIAANSFNNPGRTFLIKNDSSNPVSLVQGSGVTLVHVDGTTGNDVLSAFSLAMYITDFSSPSNTFRRLLSSVNPQTSV